MKLLLLAGAGLTAAALPFSSSDQAADPAAPRAVESDLRAAAAAAQDDTDDLLLQLRLRHGELEREAELLGARMELEGLARRQDLALASRAEIRELRAQQERLEFERRGLEERADDVSAESDRRLHVAMVEAEAEVDDHEAALRADLRSELEARRDAYTDQLIELRRALSVAYAEEDDEAVMTLETRMEAMESSTGAVEARLREQFERQVERHRAERETELARLREALEAEAMERRRAMARDARELEMEQRRLEERAEDLALRAEYEEHRLELETELAARERQMALSTEMERIEIEMERVHMAREQDDDDERGDAEDLEEDLGDVWEAIQDLRAEVAELKGEVEELKGDAERFR